MASNDDLIGKMRRRSTAWCVALTLVLGASALRADNEFSTGDLRGAYGFTFELTVGGGAPPIVAVGQFTADGAGTYAGERTVNLGTASPANSGVFRQTFSCTYSVGQNGTGSAICSTPFGPERFAFVLVAEGKEVLFVSVTPGISLRGIARKQSP